MMTIEILKENDIEMSLQEEIVELYNQLNSTIEQLSISKVLENNPNIVVVLCREEKTVMGIAMMAMYKVISGHKGMVEDVVVHSDHRGKGIGRKLIEKLLEEAQNRKLSEVLLFSGHHRKPAINLYKSLGFQLKDSGLYRLILD
ncbi:GNAT family N-acetyltransferase [Maribacter halichondriae]|uniref:GNAT family N-acetyltransferase n=1 Tax=Maribacter halichondriae TaxID=2980554 RepID=UPI002358E43A|nr:GNAT family N-acetyltransferase [Maribacter sp. Hal144]